MAYALVNHEVHVNVAVNDKIAVGRVEIDLTELIEPLTGNLHAHRLREVSGLAVAHSPGGGFYLLGICEKVYSVCYVEKQEFCTKQREQNQATFTQQRALYTHICAGIIGTVKRRRQRGTAGCVAG